MTQPSPPGLNPVRLLRQALKASQRCSLDLKDLTVLTEAANGPYVITPIMAAIAGAKVFAITRSTRYGSFQEIQQATVKLAAVAGVSNRIEIFEALSKETIAQADIITNSGHLRPIDADMVAVMKATAVVPLMYEAWELRDSDVDVEACLRRGIGIAGTNERHPAIDVFSFLGVMALKLLMEAGVPVYGSNIILLCDNPFASFIENGLRRAGATVSTASQLAALRGDTEDVDAILVALRPRKEPVLNQADLHSIRCLFPGAVVARFWGDVNPVQLAAAGIPFWPAGDIVPGHMGILPSAIGPDAVIRLQCGGLKVGEVMAAAARRGHDPIEAAVISGFGQALPVDSAYTCKSGI